MITQISLFFAAVKRLYSRKKVVFFQQNVLKRKLCETPLTSQTNFEEA